MIHITNTAWAAETYASYATINNPIVFYQSFLRPQDISATTYVEDRPAINLWNPDTASKWQSSSTVGGGTIVSQFYITLANSTALKPNYIAICGHNLHEDMWGVRIEASSNGGATWSVHVPEVTITTPEPIVFFFNEAATSAFIFRIRIYKTKSAGSGISVIPAAIISHIKMGRPLVLYRRIFSSFDPAITKKAKLIQNKSENGQYLGQVVLSTYREPSDIEQKNQPYEFVRNEVVPFLNHCNGQPRFTNTAAGTFVLAWRPAKHPAELIYCWVREIKYPANETGNSVGGYMSWGVSVDASV